MYDDDDEGWWLAPMIAWVLEGGWGLILFCGLCVGIGYWEAGWPGAVIGLMGGSAVGALYTLVMGEF